MNLKKLIKNQYIKIKEELNKLSSSDTLHWFQLAVPNPTKKNQNVQYGCLLEEVAEILEATGDTTAAEVLRDKAESYKEGSKSLNLNKKASIEFLDALCDIRVTAIGCGYMLGMDIEGAIQEVDNSNFSKFVDGKPIFDKNGKITKGKDYFKPNLEKYL